MDFAAGGSESGVVFTLELGPEEALARVRKVLDLAEAFRLDRSERL
jgi:hypothetical protein